MVEEDLTGPKNRIMALMASSFARQYPMNFYEFLCREKDKYSVDANQAEDMRCLAAKCVYGSHEEALDSCHELSSKLTELDICNPDLFTRLGRLGRRADKIKLERSLDRAVNNMCKREGRDLDKERHKPAGD